MKNRIRINGTIIFLCLFAIIFFPSKFLRHSSSLFYKLLEIFGLSFILFGQLIRISSRGYKADYSKGGNTLIKDGPYFCSRNPMYLGILFMGLGIVMFIFKWWMILVFLVFFIFRYSGLILKEEKILIEKFGQEYLNYQKNTPRLFPKINLLFGKNTREYFPLKASWLKKELNSFVLILVVIFAIKFWVMIWK